MIVYIQDLCFQIMGIQVQLIEKFQNPSQQRVYLDKCETFGAEVLSKPSGEILKPGVNCRNILFAQKAD